TGPTTVGNPGGGSVIQFGDLPAIRPLSAQSVSGRPVHRGTDWDVLPIVTPHAASGGNSSLATADAIDPNARIDGTLASGQTSVGASVPTDWYRFTVSAVGRLDALAAAGDGSVLKPRLALYGPDGRLLLQSDGTGP